MKALPWKHSDRPEVNTWQFTEVSLSAGIDFSHGFAISNTGSSHDRLTNAAGVAAGDYDRDGWVDLYVIHGTIGANQLIFVTHPN